VTTQDVTRWRRNDDEFGKSENRAIAGVLAARSTRVRKKVDQLIDAEDDDGNPKYPAQVMAVAKSVLPEFAPQSQSITHKVQGAVEHTHSHSAVLAAMPDDLLQKFLETGESSIEMDRVAETVWEEKKKK